MKNTMDVILHKLLEWLPILAIVGTALSALARWVSNLKKQIVDAHSKISILNNRLNEIESRQGRFEDKIDQSLLEVNRRIDDCKNSILDNIQIVLRAITKT